MIDGIPGVGDSGIKDVLALFDQVMQGPMQQQVPCVMKTTLALRPDIYSAMMAAVKPILFEGALPVSVKQMIVMVIGDQRKCRFCRDAHRRLLEALGIDEAVIESCIDDPEMKRVPPAYRQIIRFALLAAQNPNGVDDSQFELLRDSGLNEEEILEAAMVASFANFLVTWANVRASFGD